MKPNRIRYWRGRTAVNVLWNTFLLCLLAWRADGHYSQPDLWALGFLGASLLSWLVVYTFLLVLDRIVQ